VTLLLLSTADTDLLAARSVPEPALELRLANPARVDDPVALLDGVRLVVVRLLGGRRAWEGFDVLRSACAERRVPLVAVGGEGALDAELADASTVPAGVVADADAYLREGGPGNLGQLVAFLSDTVLLTGVGFTPPTALPAHGLHRPTAPPTRRGRRSGVGLLPGATSCQATPPSSTCSATRSRRRARTPAVFVGSLRPDGEGRCPSSTSCCRRRRLVVTVLASGGSTPATRGLGRDRARPARRAGAAGAVPDEQPGRLGASAAGARRSTPPCRWRSRVRRPPRHGAFLVEGDR
jgi:cobaltochelatase CobN